MIQRVISIIITISGIYLLMNDSIFLGIALFILGAAIYNGSRQDSWFSFHFDRSSDSSCDDGGGGD